MTDTPNLPALRTEQELVNPTTDSWTEVLPQVAELARSICNTDFVPAALRNNVAATTAAILYNREIGLPPMTGLNAVHVIKGKVGISAEMMRAQVLAAGHEIWPEETNSAFCIMAGQRAGSDRVTTVRFSEEDAKRAGLFSNDNYRKNPRRMYQARATSELCALLFPDVIRGMASTEDLMDEVDAGEPDTTAGNGSAPVQRKTRRKASPAALEAAETVDLPDGGGDVPGPRSPETGGTVPVAAAVPDESPSPPLPEPEPEGAAWPDVPDDTEIPPTYGELGQEAATESDIPTSEPADEQPPKPASRAVLRAYHAAFSVLGYDDAVPGDRERRLAVTRLFGDCPDLQSSNDLTDQQAKAVLTTLARFKTRDDLIEGMARIADGTDQ